MLAIFIQKFKIFLILKPINVLSLKLVQTQDTFKLINFKKTVYVKLIRPTLYLLKVAQLIPSWTL